jgi:hypothetical protein
VYSPPVRKKYWVCTFSDQAVVGLVYLSHIFTLKGFDNGRKFGVHPIFSYTLFKNAILL